MTTSRLPGETDEAYLARHPFTTDTVHWRAATGDVCPRCFPHAWHGVRCTAPGCACPTSFKEPPTSQ